MSIKKHALSWGNLNAEINYLDELFREGELNAEQTDFVSNYINHLGDRMEDLESYIIEFGDWDYYRKVRNYATQLHIKPSDQFLNHLENQLSKRQLDGIDFQIKKAVDKYNSFYYSCAIYMDNNGYIGFNGCGMTDSDTCKVLFNKRQGNNTITIADVKSRIEKLKNTDTRTIEDVRNIISLRSYCCLVRAGYKTVQQIKEATLQDMLKVRNLGRKSLEEIQNVFDIKFT